MYGSFSHFFYFCSLIIIIGMKNTIISIWAFCMVLLTVPFAPVKAQNSEVGACVGTMFYLGELNPTRLFAQPQLAAGLVYRYNTPLGHQSGLHVRKSERKRPADQ